MSQNKFWTNRRPKVGIWEFWKKKGFEHICAQKLVLGSFGQKSAQNLLWAGRFKPAQNYGLNHPCPKLANPAFKLCIYECTLKSFICCTVMFVVYLSSRKKGSEHVKQNNGMRKH